MGRLSPLILALLWTACGRVGFDPGIGDANADTGRPGDAGVDAADTSFDAAGDARPDSPADAGSDARDAAVDASAMDPDLVVWVTFDDPMGPPVDEMGTLGTATCTAGRCPTRTPGPFGNAADFDGVDDYLRFESTDALDFSTSADPFSVSLWYRTRSIDPGRQQVLVAKATGGGNVSFQLSLEDLAPGGLLDIPFKVCATNCVSEPVATAVGGAELDTWRLVVGVWDGAESAVYVDGVEQSRAGPLTSFAFDDSPFMVGADFESAGIIEDSFDGSLDDLRIYRRALTVGEQMDLMVGAARGGGG